VLLIALIVFIIKLRKLNQPFDESDHDVDEEVPEQMASEDSVPEESLTPESEHIPEMPPPGLKIRSQLKVEAASPAHPDPLSSRIAALEDAFKQLSGKIELLTEHISKNPQGTLPKNTMQVIDAIPGALEQLKKNMSIQKPSGPPVESPILKEIAASILALQKQLASMPAKQADRSNAETVSSEKFTAFTHKLENLDAQLKSIDLTIKGFAAAKSVAGAGGGLSEDTVAVFKNLLTNIDGLKTQMSSQKQPGSSLQELKPFLEQFVNQMEEFQRTALDLKKSVSAKSGGESTLKDLSNLQQSTLDLKAAFAAATEAEEDILSRITTKLDIIHQIITSQTIGGGSSGGSIISDGGGGSTHDAGSSGPAPSMPDIIDTGGTGKDIF
ncbi:MAG: hypothetical protein ABII23_01120, partial [bacterium]